MNILIIEDDIALNNGIIISFRDKGYNFFQSYNLSEGREFLKNNNIDLIILDINLPDGSGLDFCKDIRKVSDVPIIMLTANDMETDVVTGFQLGADDYITKPFSLMILRSRVEAILRRVVKNSKSYFEIDDYVFDFDSMAFYKKEREISLSRTEQKLLNILIQNSGRTVTREILVDKIWSNSGEYVDENALSVAMNRLRNKLDAQGYIKTVYGLGYTWVIKE